MAVGPDADELIATRDRMLPRYLVTENLKHLYSRASDRFRVDLDDERDILLSECAILMMIKLDLVDHGGEGLLTKYASD